MAVSPEKHRMATPADYEADHPHESPEMWGWHATFAKGTRVGGWVTVVILLLMMTSTHYNEQGTLFLGLSAIGLVLMLLWERHRSKNSWRN